MNNLLSEDRLSLNQLATEEGKNPSTIWRWKLKGVKGVRLETISVGGRCETSRQAYHRFVERCTAAASGGNPAAPRTSNQRERDIDRAEAELAKMGV